MERVADVLFRFLADKGAETVFLLTGNGAMFINDAIAKESRLNYVCARHEAAAPMMASAHYRVSGKIGVVSVTSGPGAANAVSGLAEAWVDSAPVVVIAGQSPTNELPVRPGVRTFGTAGIDIVSAVKPLTKYAVTVTDPNRALFELEKATDIAMSGRPGPVWLDIPMDVQSALIDVDEVPRYKPSFLNEPREFDEQVEAIISAINGSSRPLVVVGQGVKQSGATEELIEFLEYSGLPFALTRLGQDVLPRTFPLNLGSLGRRGAPHSKEVLERADLVLAIGARLATQFAGHNLEHFDPDAQVFVIDIDESEVKKFDDARTVGVLADARHFLQEINRAELRIENKNWSSWVKSLRKLLDSSVIPNIRKMSRPMDLYHFMSVLDTVAQDRQILVTDAGSNYYVGGQVFMFGGGKTEVTSGTFAAMGTGIPLGIGAAVGGAGRQVLAITGDGSLELNIQELKTMSYYRLNMKLFVINNGGYVSMRNWQDTFFEGRRIGSDDSTGAEGLHLESVAHAFGLRYRRLDDPKTLVKDLEEIIGDAEPMFIEVICDDRQQIYQPFSDTETSS